MQFLKALFWVAIGGGLVLLSAGNWHDVTLNLWGDTQVDIKLPILIVFMFLLGWLPTWLIYRARLWRQKQRVETFERQQAVVREPIAAVEDVTAA